VGAAGESSGDLTDHSPARRAIRPVGTSEPPSAELQPAVRGGLIAAGITSASWFAVIARTRWGRCYSMPNESFSQSFCACGGTSGAEVQTGRPLQLTSNRGQTRILNPPCPRHDNPGLARPAVRLSRYSALHGLEEHRLGDEAGAEAHRAAAGARLVSADHPLQHEHDRGRGHVAVVAEHRPRLC
jgi:hypothetical protein